MKLAVGVAIGVLLGASAALALTPKTPKFAAAVNSRWGDEYWKPSDKLTVSFIFGKDRAGDGGEAAVEMLSADAGFTVAKHKHDASIEILYVIEGKGTMTIGGETYDVRPGTAVWVPKGVEHSFTGDATTPLLALQIYTPGGPEERFKAAPAKKFTRSDHDEPFLDKLPLP
jgi:mannose-6-phosphate isomerase-like protein (cupin superfamily)